jgi:hypothetical protein
MLFVRTLGPGARLVSLKPHIPPALHLKAWAVEVAGDQLHVLLINKGSRSVKASLSLPAGAPATLQRLLAPSPSATSRETLAGQSLDENGILSGARQLQLVARQARAYAVTLSPYSAALVSVPLDPGALARPERR